MSSRLRMVARWITVIAVAAAYVALHLLVNVGMGRQVRGSAAGASWCGAIALALLGPALWLRHRRRSAVAEIVGLVDRYGPRQPRRRRAVRVVGAAGRVLSAGGALAVAVALSERGDDLCPEVSLLLLAGGVAATGSGLLVLRRTRPYAARGAAQVLLRDGRRPVLYLRSFDDDEVAAREGGRAKTDLHTREVQFAAALGAVGPVIAVGRPGEDLPRLGAARFYLPLDDWQGTVRRLMDLSQLIVLRLGQGEGLRWEIGEARATQPPAKLILLAPGGLPELAGQVNESLPTPLLPREMVTGGYRTGAVVAFDGHWTPRVFPVKERRGPAAWMARSGISHLHTPTVHLARTIHAALAATGRRRRTMAWRAQLATRRADLVSVGLALAMVLPGWLGYRILQLAGRW
ncbi:transferase [Kitasatospora sp. NPDC101235]|uniref:transferase n=1 Tax=Kitasatospora sp. NPDC101235 TaxID=3364101 RepID=UPI0037FB0687